MATTAALYTPQVLGLATSLALYPWDEALPLRGEARSATCGSSLTIGLELSADGRITRFGMKVHACAIGQASAAIFAAEAAGRDRAALTQAEQAIAAWLAGDDLPNWPGLAAIAAARAYPARHGAILLAWRAALAALPTAGNRR